jgi:lysophospholipase L1-like esterase
MEWYEEEVRCLERKYRENPPPQGAIAFYGSSSVRLWETLTDDFSNDPVINLAFGGSTLEACAWFFERIVVPCAPVSIVCYAGDNDLGDGRCPEETLAYFRALLARVDTHFPERPFSFISIKQSPSRIPLADKILRTNDLIRQEIAGRPHRYYIDIHSRMLQPDGEPDVTLFLDDGLHVSPKGYRVWRTVLNEWRDKIF